MKIYLHSPLSSHLKKQFTTPQIPIVINYGNPLAINSEYSMFVTIIITIPGKIFYCIFEIYPLSYSARS